MISKWLPPVDQKITGRWNQRANNQLSLNQRKNMLFMQDDGSFLSSLLFWICPMQWYVPRNFSKHFLSKSLGNRVIIGFVILKKNIGQVYHCLCKMHLKWVSSKAMYSYVEMLLLNRLIDYICFYIRCQGQMHLIMIFICIRPISATVNLQEIKCSVWFFSKQNIFCSSHCYFYLKMILC